MCTLTHTQKTHSEDMLWASIQLQADMSQTQLAFPTDHFSRAARDRVSSGARERQMS